MDGRTDGWTYWSQKVISKATAQLMSILTKIPTTVFKIPRWTWKCQYLWSINVLSYGHETRKKNGATRCNVMQHWQFHGVTRGIYLWEMEDLRIKLKKMKYSFIYIREFKKKKQKFKINKDKNFKARNILDLGDF